MAVGTVGKKALEAINELVRRGVSPNEIYRKTGYKRGIDGKWLDMSQEARMGRAKEQGFSEERLFHGTAEDIDEFEKPITWLTTDKDLSDEYALQAGWRKEQKEKGKVWRSGGDPDLVEPPGGENVVPVVTSAKNPVEFVHAEQRKNISEFLSEIMGQSKGFKDRDRALSLYEDLKSKYGDTKTEQFEYWQDPNVAKFIDEMGFDSIKVRERGSDTVGILKPKNIRSVNAAFDPAAKESSNLLASAAPFAVGIGLAGLAASPDSAMAASTGTIESPAAPWLVDAANYMRRLELPIVGRPLEGLADWAEGAAYQDPDRLKRAAIGALDLM